MNCVSFTHASENRTGLVKKKKKKTSSVLSLKVSDCRGPDVAAVNHKHTVTHSDNRKCFTVDGDVNNQKSTFRIRNCIVMGKLTLVMN